MISAPVRHRWQRRRKLWSRPTLPALHLPGVAGNHGDVADEAALDITGDIELITRFRTKDWEQDYALNCKWQGSSNRSWRWWWAGSVANSAGFKWSTDGTGTGELGASSGDVFPSFGYLEWVWLRLAFDVSEYTVTHYYSRDQVTDPADVSWTSVKVVSGTGPTEIASTAADVEIGMLDGSSQPAAGDFGRSRILDGLGGTKALDVNFHHRNAWSADRRTVVSASGPDVSVLRT